MKIGCLGWGSLVWNPKGLPVRGTWFKDGPFLPIEFARESNDGRITLVLTPEVPLVHSLWTLLSIDNLDNAKIKLAEREGIKEKNIIAHIGFWKPDLEQQNEYQRLIGEWAECMTLDAVVWTALPPKFSGKKDGEKPSAEEVVLHLTHLPYEKKKHAEEYIRMTPRQIDTNYRRHIEATFNWSSISHI